VQVRRELYPIGYRRLIKVDLKSRELNEPELHDSTAPAPGVAIPRFETRCDGLLAIPYQLAQTNLDFRIHLLVLEVQQALFLERGLPVEGVFCAKDQI